MGVRSSHQTVSGASKKIVLPSIFVTSLSSLMMWNLQSYPTTVLNEKNLTFMGGFKHTLTLLHIFRGSRHPTPGSTPAAGYWMCVVPRCIQRASAEVSWCRQSVGCRPAAAAAEGCHLLSTSSSCCYWTQYTPTAAVLSALCNTHWRLLITL